MNLVQRNIGNFKNLSVKLNRASGAKINSGWNEDAVNSMGSIITLNYPIKLDNYDGKKPLTVFSAF